MPLVDPYPPPPPPPPPRLTLALYFSPALLALTSQLDAASLLYNMQYPEKTYVRQKLFCLRSLHSLDCLNLQRETASVSQLLEPHARRCCEPVELIGIESSSATKRRISFHKPPVRGH